MSGPNPLPRHWETHLYGYAYFCANLHGRISDESRAIMRLKCLRHGHTERQCNAVEADPIAFIKTGRLV